MHFAYQTFYVKYYISSELIKYYTGQFTTGNGVHDITYAYQRLGTTGVDIGLVLQLILKNDLLKICFTHIVRPSVTGFSGSASPTQVIQMQNWESLLLLFSSNPARLNQIEESKYTFIGCNRPLMSFNTVGFRFKWKKECASHWSSLFDTLNYFLKDRARSVVIFLRNLVFYCLLLSILFVRNKWDGHLLSCDVTGLLSFATKRKVSSMS